MHVLDTLATLNALTNAVAIPLDQIKSSSQPREHFDGASIRFLANSLVEDKQLQPVRVRYDVERNVYWIIAGERRLRAARLAGLETLDCIVEERPLSDADILRHQIVENALRENLSPVELGRAFVAVMEYEGLDQKRLAARLNIHPATVSRMVGLLGLREHVQEKVERGELAITKALKQKEGKPAKPKKQLPKSKKLKTSLGITVTLQSRKPLHDPNIILALRELLESIQSAAESQAVAT